MRRAAASLLVASCLLVAGCGIVPGGKKQASITEQDAARAKELAKVKGWDRMFQPDVTVGAANQFGFRAQPYGQATGAYRTQGGPVTIASSFAKTPNQVAFKAEGKSAALVDKIAFDLSLADAEGAKDARTRFATLVRDFLYQSKIDAQPVQDAIAKGETAEGDLAGATFQVARTPVDGVDHLTVTFTRIGASAPANSKTQG